MTEERDKYRSDVDYSFWMDGFLTRDPDRIDNSLDPLADSVDPAKLYVISGSFEGEWQVMQFSAFERSDFLPVELDETENSSSQLNSEDWSSSMDEESYIGYVDEIKSQIAAGWVYQVNGCRLLSTRSRIALEQVFGKIQQQHQAPAASYFKSDRWQIASASPETFFRVRQIEGRREIATSPIKGTSRDGRFKEKDSAENVMIVDLMRNDISPLCKIGTVNVPRLLGVEEHPGLFHLVSDVVGELRDEVSWKEILERLSPAGSISGAPKSSALDVIRRFEPYRGAYCGTLGWIHQGEAHFSVLIRTFFKDLLSDHHSTYFGTGAGITWGSDGEDEWQETELKAERLIAIASGNEVSA